MIAYSEVGVYCHECRWRGLVVIESPRNLKRELASAAVQAQRLGRCPRCGDENIRPEARDAFNRPVLVAAGW